MKTNQLMTRKMGEFNVLQRTSDGFFNATELFNQWKKANPDDERRLDKFWDSTHLPELMAEIAKNEYNFNSHNFGELKKLLSQSKRGRHNSGTWMHPILFIKAAMYINPAFEYKVIKFVHDQMIQYRKDAGDAYKEMCAAIAKINAPNKLQESIKEVSRGLNYIVFGKHEKMMRNQVGDESKQRELQEMERKVADLINDGFISEQSELMNYLRKKWQQKYTPAIFKH